MSSFDPVFLWILLFGVLASVGALAPAGLVLLLSEGVRARLTPYLLSFATGTVLATALIGLLASPALGVATAVAVIGHEIPQELGDFVLLLEGGFSRAKALLWNGLSGLATLAGAVLAYVALAQATWVVPYALAVAASGFLYIGLADLVPGLHGRRGAASGILQFLMMLLGIAIIAFIQH